MKFRTCIILLIATLLLTGCNASTSGNGSVAAGNTGAVGGAAAPAVNQSASQAAITKERAEAIALEHAGFTAQQVTGLRTEYEIDDGVPRYEVQFRQGRWEYDYEINANTGAILSYDRDD